MDRLDTNHALALCGLKVRKELRRYYGSGDAAAEAVRDASKHRDSLEQWASMVTAGEERVEGMQAPVNGAPFRFADLPPAMRDAAAECLAAAMLAYTAEQERSAS